MNATPMICTCGAGAGDYVDPTTRLDCDCDCDAVFKIAAALRKVEGLSLLAGAVAPSVSSGLLVAIEDVIANHREG